MYLNKIMHKLFRLAAFSNLVYQTGVSVVLPTPEFFLTWGSDCLTSFLRIFGMDRRAQNDVNLPL
jgi:hypothetical protein